MLQLKGESTPKTLEAFVADRLREAILRERAFARMMSPNPPRRPASSAPREN